MNKAYLLLISVMWLTGCEQISRKLVSNNFDNIPVGHCRSYKAEPTVMKVDLIELIDDSRGNDE